MNSKRVNQMTAVFLTVLFCFILFSPTINALEFDPNSIWNQHHPGEYTPSGDTDPWNDLQIYDPPPDDNNRFSGLLRDSKIATTTYLYLKLGWYLNIIDKNDGIKENTNIITPINCENDSIRQIRNR